MCSSDLNDGDTGNVGYTANLATATVSCAPFVDVGTKAVSFGCKTGATGSTSAYDLFQDGARMYFTVSYLAA